MKCGKEQRSYNYFFKIILSKVNKIIINNIIIISIEKILAKVNSFNLIILDA